MNNYYEFKIVRNETEEVVIKFTEDVDYPELIDQFKYFSLAVGFHPETIKRYLEDEE